MRHTLVTLSLLLLASVISAAPYDICFISDNPDPVCLVLKTDLPKDDIVAVVEYPTGDVEINIAGVNVNMDCKDNNGDSLDDECLIRVEAADSPYHSEGTVLSFRCANNTLLTKKADGQGGTYTNSQMNSIKCGYVVPDNDPCYSGSWYVGQGNPECEEVNVMEYRKYCTIRSSGSDYGLAVKFTNCPAQ